MKILAVVLIALFFHPYSRRINDKERAGNASVGQAFFFRDSSIKIIDHYNNIQSMRELLRNFKGKPVWIDMWATWCEPCLEEFKHSETLYRYLEKRGIEIVYISIDKEDRDKAWRKTIYDYKLSGYHIRANKALQDDLTILIWGAKDVYSIPHYLLFGKDGRCVDKNAPLPGPDSAGYREMELKLNK